VPPILAWPLLAVSVSLLLYGCWLSQWMHADDAFITFRYAENLARGLGPVYNAGEHVEGYSTPLYMFSLAGASALGFELMPLSRTVGLASVLAIIAVLYRGLRKVGLEAWGAALATFPLSTCFYVHLSSVAGMETMPHALLLFTGLLLLGDSEPTRKTTLLASFLLILSALTRPEGIAFWGLGLLLVVATDRRQLSTYMLPFSLFVAHLAWRYSYYGDLLPNTYYVKVGGGFASFSAGWKELRHYFENLAHSSWLILAIAGAWAGASLPQERRRVLVMSTAVIFHVGYVVSVGGDSLGLKRFYIPVLPLLAYLVGLAFLKTPRLDLQRNWWRTGVAVTFALALGYSLFLLLVGKPPLQDHGYFTGNRKLGEHLAKTRDPSTRIAVSAAGAIPYFSGLPALDLYGLNDRHISRQPFSEGHAYTGHAKWDPTYVLSEEPDLVVVNRGYLPAGFNYSKTIELAMRNPANLGTVQMERELFSLLMKSGAYALRVLDFEDGSAFFVFERRDVTPQTHNDSALDRADLPDPGN
jgi:arabinofuranosyltransferase